MNTQSKLINGRAKELRTNQTITEKLLWYQLRNRQVNNLKFRRQHPIGSYIVDFYCFEAKLVIEVDGDSHLDQVEYDLQRTHWLEEQGLRVLRFTNEEVYFNLDGVIEAIAKFCKREGPLT